ncbi:MAG: HAD-IIIA family hydrolase [Bacteroidales bacterium]|jgi:3-deoxy-D-manno-octulosonate 8-phosphate phosphatase (KDO 8-P phosphatase)|nr:HAD-IIIA family hydrolase [Bacteroidales bacterium]MBQ5783390.1 HAD-IIIA family hydrolase [Bacteroidales bacterium]
MSNYKTKLKDIKAFAFDVDGVFTDGSVLVMPDGDLLRTHDAKDGYGVRWAYLCGYHIGIITGAGSESVRKRFEGIGVEHIYLKSRNKLPDFYDFCKKCNIEPHQVAFMGDDVPDIPILKVCGLAVCPSDAVEEVKEVCDFVSIRPGGKGAVRDLIEQVLKIQGKWEFDPELYEGKFGKGANNGECR